MFQDMKEPVSYLPQAILIGLAAAAAGSFLLFAENRIKKGPLPGRSRSAGRHAFLIFTLFLFAVYLTVLLQEAFFSRPPGSRTSVNLEFLGTWGHSAQGNAYVIENIIMFIPWGMLLPLLIAPMQKRGWLCVLTAFLASVSLETVQYLTLPARRRHHEYIRSIRRLAGYSRYAWRDYTFRISYQPPLTGKLL